MKLYEELTPEQKRKADEILTAMGCMISFVSGQSRAEASVVRRLSGLTSAPVGSSNRNEKSGVQTLDRSGDHGLSGWYRRRPSPPPHGMRNSPAAQSGHGRSPSRNLRQVNLSRPLPMR